LTAGPAFRFVGGKGGVGKTTCAAALAVAAAERGRTVLAVSMDPAHSLGDALGASLAGRPRRIATRRGALYAAELDADGALRRFLAARGDALRAIVEGGTWLDRADVDRFLGLGVPGVDELMGLVELLDLAAARGYAEVVVDGAPTGHMLRLLAMPGTLRRIARALDVLREKQRVLVSALGRGRARGDAAEDVIDELERVGRETAALLRDARRAAFTWVLLPEEMALAEARDGIAALEAEGMRVDDVIVDRVTPPPPGPCGLCAPRRRAESAVLAAARRAWGARVRVLPTLGTEPRGVDALRAAGRRITRPPAGRGRRPSRRAAARMTAGPPPPWVAAFAPSRLRVVLLGGKGGVGKTSAAVVVADALARAGRRRVLLLSADPAHSLADALDAPVGDRAVPVRGARGVSARELDASAAHARRRDLYRRGAEALFDAIGRGTAVDSSLDRAAARELFDLAPPGIDELFAVLAVNEALAAGPAAPDVVVVDTAPTGHALRLLALPDAAREWARALLAVLLKYREVAGLGELAASTLDLSRDLGALGALLRDRTRCAFVVVARPGELPRRETVRLLASLDGLGVPVGGLIVNGVTADAVPSRRPAALCSRCRREAAEGRGAVERLRSALDRSHGGAPVLVAPVVAPPPRGLAALRAWGNRWTMGPHAQPQARTPPRPPRRAARSASARRRG
jgi:arsenite-transporting ATPase